MGIHYIYRFAITPNKSLFDEMNVKIPLGIMNTLPSQTLQRKLQNQQKIFKEPKLRRRRYKPETKLVIEWKDGMLLLATVEL